MSDIETAREQINLIDREIAVLFEKRMSAAKTIAEYKLSNGLPVKDDKRETEVIERNRKYISNPVIESYYVDFQKMLMNISCDYQSHIIDSKGDK